jgi:hypothetical protein
MIIHPPSKDLALIVNIERVVVSTEYVNCFLSMNLFNSQCLLILVSSVQHPTYLPTLWITPPLNFAIICQQQSMMSSTCQLYYPHFAAMLKFFLGYSRGHLHWVASPSSHCILKKNLNLN